MTDSRNRLQMIRMRNQWLVMEVLEQLKKGKKLSVCSEASTMELVSAPWVKSYCACGTGIFRKPRKKNVRRWKPVLGQQTGRTQYLYCELQTVWISDSARLWIIIRNYECPINPVTNPKTPRLFISNTTPRSCLYFLIMKCDSGVTCKMHRCLINLNFSTVRFNITYWHEHYSPFRSSSSNDFGPDIWAYDLGGDKR
jgi:hypothetical protein